VKRAAPPPAAGLRQRVQRWWLARLPTTDHLELTQNNIFLLPTGAGWMLALTLLVLLIASINFQLNLGYLLTFLLAGSAAAGVVMGHNSLRGLQLRLLPPEPCFQGHGAAHPGGAHALCDCAGLRRSAAHPARTLGAYRRTRPRQRGAAPGLCASTPGPAQPAAHRHTNALSAGHLSHLELVAPARATAGLSRP